MQAHADMIDRAWLACLLTSMCAAFSAAGETCLRGRVAASGAGLIASAPDISCCRSDDTSAFRCVSWVCRLPIRRCTASRQPVSRKAARIDL